MTKRSAIILASVLAAAQAPRTALGQTAEDSSLEFFAGEAEVLTVASPVPESTVNSVANVAVIDRAAIERYGFASVAEALQTVPGVAVTKTYLLHALPTIRGALQEHYADKVLVMVDNVPMWHAVTGEGDLDRVDIDSVERIEVLRGPSSVLYGSNALSGVVNIVLRRPAEKDGVLGLVGGGLGSSYGGYGGLGDVARAHGLYAKNGGPFSYMLSAGLSNTTQPAYPTVDETGARMHVVDFLHTRTLNFKGVSERGSFLFNASRSEQNYLGNSLSLASGALMREVREGALGSFSYDLAPAWGGLRYTTTYDHQRRNIPRDAADDLRSDIVGSRFVNSLGGRVELPADFSVEFGGEHEYRHAQRYQNYLSHTDDARGDNGLLDRASWEGALHMQVGYGREPWKVLAGSRFTHAQGIADNVSSRVSAVYLLGEGGSVKAMFSQSYRTPTPFERYFLPAPVTVLGNPSLRPERAETFELSTLLSRGRFFTHLTAYYTTYKDSIFRDLGTFTRDGVTYVNANHYRNATTYNSKGLELEGRYAGRQTKAFLAAELLQGSRGDEHPIPAPGAFGLPGGTSWNFKYVPTWTAKAGLSRDIGPLQLSSNLNALGATGSLRGTIAAQAWADASVAYSAGPARHALTVRNLSDATILVPEYVRQRVVESLQLYTGRRLEYTFRYRF